MNKNVILKISVFLLFIFVFIAFIQKIVSYLSISTSLKNIIIAIFIIFIGSLFINFIENRIKIFFKRFNVKKRREQNLLNFIFLTLSYLILVLVTLKFLNINVTNILLGGAFIGVILGIAAQSVLSNLFAGIIILLFNQFEIGERIKFTTWQYSFLLPSYPPKFFSNDIVTPGQIGVIYNVGLFYTDFIGDEGFPIKIPNSILIQAAIQRIDKAKFYKLQIKYEVLKKNKFSIIKEKIDKILDSKELSIFERSIYIEESTMESYIVKIVLKSNNSNIDYIKSFVLEKLIDTL